MTDPTLTLMELLRKNEVALDTDFLREGVRRLMQLRIELEASPQVGAGRYERTGERQTYRKGYRPRQWETRVGEIPLQIPKLREESYFPCLLEPRKRSEQALLAVVQQAYVLGVSTRKVDNLVQALGLSGADKSKVSRICQELDNVVTDFQQRPLTGDYPYVWLDALYLKVRQAAVTAVGVNCQGERALLGSEIGAGEDEAFWLASLRSLVQRGLQGGNWSSATPTKA